ncbi:hypothetical protein Cob_v003811 [Colletotrichum orbiculare MAFF 240422]|uniref:Dolichyl-diphosphooligosaccharide--protein glycosyltransferase subunit 4 n=1 Tax=Colletotrichum orbiculare (strain 104-T / ATCC 96160 / CBS 514.97 / LARS 414 / MAFF 240422) TaxID=1213857 RepID=A0A484G1J5_COLOR|nr:hypothetical protein Cob_v003811 [Colletotrichum orbiculare MAFF 240422]
MKSEVRMTVGGSREGLNCAAQPLLSHNPLNNERPIRRTTKGNILTTTPFESPLNSPRRRLPAMISDNDLYRLAIFLGSAAMVLIIVYHYVEVNSKENEKVQQKYAQPAKVSKASS